jgi:BACON domain-containing protein
VRRIGKEGTVMKTIRVAFVVFSLAAGCKEGGPALQQRKVCVEDKSCETGFLCSAGVCASEPPTAALYNACSLDVDCPVGDHCDLGACAHDCVADRDCAGNETCDIRGRCAAPALVNEPAPPAPPTAAAPVLEVAGGPLDFSSFAETKTISLRNVGEGSLDYRMLADRTWLAADPLTGTIARGESADVTISVARVGTGTRGRVSVISTGGTASVHVSIPDSLAGLYQGAVHITLPSDLGTRALALGLAQDAGGHLVGVVDDARSPAFAYRAALDGASRVERDQVWLRFVIPGRTGTGGNPSYPRDILRTITVSGTLMAGGKITGSYAETFEGVFSTPAVLTGTVELAPVDRAAPLLPAQSDTLSVAPAPAPTFLACDICPNGACPTDHTQAGREFLLSAFKFYDQAIADGSNDAYAPIRACVDTPTGCFDPIALHCAQAHFYQAIKAGGSHVCAETGSADCAQRGLLDTFKGLLVWNSVYGNEHMVRAYELGRSLTTQRGELATARAAFARGLVGDSGGGARVRGLLDPFFLEWASRLPVSVWANAQPSILSEELAIGGNSASKTVPAFGDFDRMKADLGLWIEALQSELVATHRLSDREPRDLVLQAGNDEADVHNMLALASVLAARMNADDRLSDVVHGAARLADKVRQIGNGLNPAGYPEAFIAFTYNPALGATSNNYRELMKDFMGSWIANARDTYGAAQGIQRDFESSYQQVTQQLVATNADYGKRVADLCGGSASRPSTASCGASGGLVFDTAQQLQSAYRRLENATAAVQNAYAEIQIEQNRASQQANIHNATAVMISEDGRQLEALAQRESDLEQLQGMLGGLAGAIGGIASGDYAGAFQATANAAIGAALAGSKLDIEKERIRIDTVAKARVEYNQAKEVLIDSAARVKTLMLQIPTLKINALLAQDDITRLAGLLRSQLQEAEDAQAALGRMRELSNQDPRRDPAYRQYRHRTTTLAVEAFDQALNQMFLVTRALEYEIGMSYGRRGDLFSLMTPAELVAYAAGVEAAYQRYIATVGNAQQRQTTLSLRDQLFRFGSPLQDNATGGTYQPADVFHRLLAEPRNRDADGNVRLTFSLSLAPDAFLFNRSLCTDKITGIRVSLVGAALGAIQPEVVLQQRGSAYLRSCTDTGPSGDYAITEYNLENTIGVRRAIVQAGLNLASAGDMSSGGPVDTEFYGRPIAAPYELIIDRNAPANANLDLTRLDDIVLFISHETRTVR